jgi:hypothetical protein
VSNSDETDKWTFTALGVRFPFTPFSTTIAVGRFSGRLAYWCGQLSVKQPLHALLVQFQPDLPFERSDRYAMYTYHFNIEHGEIAIGKANCLLNSCGICNSTDGFDSLSLRLILRTCCNWINISVYETEE